MSKTFVEQVAELSQKYGVAWLIVNQTLGWITYLMIYALLVFTEIDILAFFAQYRFTQKLIANLSPSAGNLALAFAINRLGTPVRLVATTALMPYCAPTINSYVNPFLIRMGLYRPAPVAVDDPDYPGVEEVKKNQ
ncbi:hypothetical protein HDV04_005100 [Boothiomyces sp. JEL0838]|nr:hypothetical protein HDV04_005100 [Boothiomyces sp. JEL0838]